MNRRTFVQSLPTITLLAATVPGFGDEAKAPIELLKPEVDGGRSVLAALRIRRTIRDISPDPLPPQMLSNLLWAAFGVNCERGPFGQPGRTAASASNSQEIDLYVALADGIYLYDAGRHRLTPVVAGDFREQAGGRGRGSASAKAPVNLIFVVDLAKYTKAPLQEPRPEGPGVSEALLRRGHRADRRERVSVRRLAGIGRVVSQLQSRCVGGHPETAARAAGFVRPDRGVSGEELRRGGISAGGIADSFSGRELTCASSRPDGKEGHGEENEIHSDSILHRCHVVPFLAASNRAGPVVGRAVVFRRSPGRRRHQSIHLRDIGRFHRRRRQRDGTNSAARFNHPSGVTVDSAGNLYVADTGNSTIRQIGPRRHGGRRWRDSQAPRTARTEAAARRAFTRRRARRWIASGNVYVADEGNYTVRKITPAGAVTALAGAAGNAGSPDGTNSAARFGHPSGVAVDTAGNVYVADWGNHTIRKITPAGLVTTFAGKAGNAGSADGTGSNARFNQPSAVAVDNATNVYVADTGNCTIRKITPAGVVTTLAGKPGYLGSTDGSGSAARFGGTNAGPNGLTVDFFGNIYVADTGNNTIRQVTPYGVVTTLAGQAGMKGSADGTGPAALFDFPSGVAADNFGNVWVADTGNNTVRQIAPGGVVTTWAGQAAVTGSADATGSAASFFNPFGITVDGAANIYVADAGNNTVRMVSPYGVVRTLAGQAGIAGSADGNGGSAQFNDPTGIAVDGGGNLFVADAANGTIREITGDTTVTTLAGRAGQPGNADGNGSMARFYYPSGLTVDGSGNIWLADTGNSTIRQITAGPTITTLAGQPDSPGSGDGLGSMAQFYYPYSVAVNSAGVAYVADTYNHTVRQIEVIDLFFATEITVTTLAGQAGTAGGADGNGGSAQFNYPEGIAVDSVGNIYVADTANNTIRLVTSDGTVTTLAGLAGSPGNADGTGGAARFNRPLGVALDSTGNIYVADTCNQCLRKGVPTLPDQPVIDAVAGLVGQTRQLNTTPQTATAWRWSLIRRPANSTAALSSTTIRNPTFTPDVADLYVFQLRASNASGKISLFTVSFTATNPPVPPVVSTLKWSNKTCSVTLQSNSGSSYTLDTKTRFRSPTG